MSLAYELRRRSRHAVVPVLSACVIAYFGYHIVQGDYGLIAWSRLGQEIEATKAERAKVSAEREMLSHRVALLRPQSLDPDLLDERARASLGFVNKNDVIILDTK